MNQKSWGRIASATSGMLMGFVSLFVYFFSSIPIITVVSLRGLFGFLLLLIFVIVTKRVKQLWILLKNGVLKK